MNIVTRAKFHMELICLRCPQRPINILKLSSSGKAPFPGLQYQPLGGQLKETVITFNDKQGPHLNCDKL